MDILSASWGDGKLAWYENTDGLGNFSDQKIIAYISKVRSVHVSDIDQDGDMDIIAGSNNNSSTNTFNKVLWFENLGIVGNSISGVIQFDLDANGCDDLDLPMPNFMVTSDNGNNS